MNFTTNILSLTPFPFLSVVLWIVLLISAMYFSRKPFQKAMTACGLMIYRAMRLSASALMAAEKRLQRRNREVLAGRGLELAERRIEREFVRIAESVRRDLEGYPQLQRRLQEEIQKLANDYKSCAQIPQNLPDWIKVIEAVGKIRPDGDQTVVSMLSGIHAALNEQHRIATEQHRRDVARRHLLLSRMAPFWHRLQRSLSSMQDTIARIDQRSRTIDHDMDVYENIRKADDVAMRQLHCSAASRFFISGLMLAVVALGAVINFNLIAQPMSELVGGSGTIGMFRTADVTGMFLVSLQLALGFLIMDSLCVTRFFKVFDGMPDGRRRLIVAGLMLVLVVLAGVESLLAYLRDHHTADLQDLRHSLAGAQAQPPSGQHLLRIGHMVMGFILPFIMSLAAIPCEAFLSSARMVAGILLGWLLRTVAFMLRLAGNLGRGTAGLVILAYDVVIFPGLWFESFLATRKMAHCDCKQGRLAAEPARQVEKSSLSSLPDDRSENPILRIN